MKKFILQLLFLLPISLYCQYLEDFNIADRGVTNAVPFTTNYTGVNWTITQGTSPNPAGIASGDHFRTLGGALISNDLDVEYCLYLPILNISSPAGARTINIPFDAQGFEFGDYIQVDYMLNNSGTWLGVPNQFGGAVKTVDMPSTASETTFNGTITQTGITGSSLRIRVCCNSTSSIEDISIFSVGVPQTGTIVLPVTWGLVRARKKDSANEVFWSTHTEINNDHFDVERSIGNEEDFEYLASVKGKGNTTISSEYSYIDNTVNTRSTDVHYRIKQIDYDGKYDYSPVVSVKSKKETIEMATPNPFQNELTVYSNEIDLLQTSASIVDIQGHLIKDIKIIDEDEDSKTIDTNGFLPGVYFIKFPSGKVTRIVKL